MTIIVRPAIAEDLPALRVLFLKSRRETFVWQPPDVFQLVDFDTQTQDELLLVAEDSSGRLSGFISIWEPDGFIHHLHVDRQCFRGGVGRALLRVLPGWPETRYRLKCLRLNEVALAFYRKCGFVKIDSGMSDEGEYLLLESGGENASII